MAISSDLIRDVTASLYEWALKKIPEDTKAALAAAEGRETNPLGRATIAIMRKSADAAERQGGLVCTDVGVPTYSVRIGTRCSFTGPIKRAIVEGFDSLVTNIQPPILCMVTNPLTNERNFKGKDMPLVSFDVIDDADYVEIVCSPKALGTGRWETMETFVSPTLAQIEKYVVESVVRAGSQPCPPIVVGVGIGGTFDYAAKMAKEATLRPFGEPNADPTLAAMEKRLLVAINKTGFGPMGTGGDSTAMAVHANYAAGHGYTPVAVCFNCWINRRTRARIYDDGRVERLE